jgi:hypothetical protein
MRSKNYCVLLFIFCFVFIPVISIAAPSISNVSGTIANGNSIILSGSGFGTKSTAAPTLWDTVGNKYTGLTNGQTIPTGGSYPWGFNNGDTVKYSNTNLRHSNLSAQYYSAPTDVTNNRFMGGGPAYGGNTTTYVSWWSQSNVPWADEQSTKCIRLSNLQNEFGDYQLSWTQHLILIWSTALNDDIAVQWAGWNGSANSNWHRTELVVNGTSLTGTVDGVSVVSTTISPSLSSPLKYIYAIGYDPNTSSGGLAQVRFGEVYADSTLSRVEICSGSTWSNRGHCEVQIPSSWSDSSITVNVNRGTFGATAPAYLYVVDSAGATGVKSISFGDTTSDNTKPTISGAPRTIDESGTKLTILASETVTCDTSGNSGFTLTASGEAATLSYLSGNSTAILTYTISRPIQFNETVTVSYTQPSGTKVQDLAGNFLDNFLGFTATNNSTQGSDSTPNAFTFIDITNAARSTVYTSNSVTITGVNIASTISVTGGTYSINGNAYTPSSGTVVNNDVVTVRQISSSSYSTVTNATLTVDGVSDTYSVTTLAGSGDTTDPLVVIQTTNPSSIVANSLAIFGTASDNVGVTSCKYHIGSAPSDSTGTALTDTTSWSGTATGFLSGANTLYVGCSDAAGNWGSSSIVVNYGSGGIAPAQNECSNPPTGTIFCADFEGTLPKSAFSDYDGNPDSENLVVTQIGPTGSATNKAIRLRVPEGVSGTSDLTKVFSSGYDTLYMRWYFMYEPGFNFNALNHGGGLIAGSRDYIGSCAEATPGTNCGAWLLQYQENTAYPYAYSYYAGMYQNLPWGDSLPCVFDSGSVFCTIPSHRPPSQLPTLVAGRWYRYDQQIEMGTPSADGTGATGRITQWIDGVLISDIQNLWIRTTSNLKLENFWLSLYHHDGTHSVEGEFIDNIVVSTSSLLDADVTPPVCAITDPTTDTTWPTSSATITVGGSATDGVGVTSISWACPTCTPASGVATCIGCTGLSVTWSQLVALSSGANVFTATATDGTNTHADVITITYTPVVETPSSIRGITMRGVYRR